MVPEAGVSRDEAGRPVVLVLDGKNKVQQRKIKTSRQIGSRWLVTDGLAAGDRVIVQGMEKAIPDATVKPQRVTTGVEKSTDRNGVELEKSGALREEPGDGQKWKHKKEKS